MDVRELRVGASCGLGELRVGVCELRVGVRASCGCRASVSFVWIPIRE